MKANVVYDFDDVISIVNDRHEHLRFHESVVKANKKEMEYQRKAKIHQMNKQLLRWFANGGYAVTGGLFVMSIVLAKYDQYFVSALVCGLDAVAAILSYYFEKRAAQF